VHQSSCRYCDAYHSEHSGHRQDCCVHHSSTQHWHLRKGMYGVLPLADELTEPTSCDQIDSLRKVACNAVVASEAWRKIYKQWTTRSQFWQARWIFPGMTLNFLPKNYIYRWNECFFLEGPENWFKIDFFCVDEGNNRCMVLLCIFKNQMSLWW
jgi:hypothetical protein